MQKRFLRITALSLAVLSVSSVFFACQKNTPAAQATAAPTLAPAAQATDAAPETIVVELAPSGGLVTRDPASAPLATPVPEATATPIPTDTPAPTPINTPHAVDGTRPEDFGYTTELEQNGEALSSYTRKAPVAFGTGDEYAKIPGVVTLRGSNYRHNAAYGTVGELTGEFRQLWTVNTSQLQKSSSGSWTGSGWTGQCLIVQWPASTRRVMNLYEEAKNKDGLIEVIYATMDGNVYFIDAETGLATRDKLTVGIPFKGAGALDPRGYPVLYLGTGDTYSDDKRKGRAMAYSLIDFKRLWEVGKAKDKFALRNWTAYDSSILVDAASDTALIPGENGIFYTLHMNTVYDEAAGKLTMTPDPVVKQRYDSPRLGPDRAGKYFYGYESSAATWRHYAFLCDNGGYARCIDLNTMETVWVQDILDDVNSTPALEESYKGVFLYVGNTVDRTAKREKGTTTFYKLDAMTGEILWKYDYAVTTTEHITGGCMSSAALGEKQLEGLVFTSFISTTGNTSGEVFAFDTDTGRVVWQYKLDTYTWCSPILLYTESGRGYLLFFDHRGKGYLFDGKTGSVIGTCKLSENIEASPCAFGDLIVIGTRDKHIFGLRVS